jgi:beta-galactosidase GanA
MKKIFMFILTVFVFINLSHSQKHINIPQNDYLPFAVWYSGGKARAPMLSQITENSPEEWHRDLQQIKSLGFNTVRTWVDWQNCEPDEGEYNFENLKLLLKLALELDLRVIIQLYSGSDGFGFAPDWAHRKFPDGFTDKQTVYEISSPPSTSFCSDHIGIRDAILNFYTETAKIASSYPNFYGWDIWSEPRSARFVCEDTRVRFRDWLSNKYKSLDELNQAWYETYRNWEDIQPQRSGGIGTYALDVDWNTFLSEKGAEDIRMQFNSIRKADQKGVITSHASPSSIFGNVLDDFLIAKSVDFYGISVYPIWTRETNLWRSVIIGPDFSYSANKQHGGFFVGEFQSGFSTVRMNIGDPVTPDDHRTWVWSLIAKGAKGINVYAYYVMSSGRESGGFGLINLDGTITERAKKLGETARVVEKNNALFANSIPAKSEIAIIYNPLTRMAGSGMDMGLTNSLIGYYRVFAENNIPVEFIHRNDLESGDLSQYKLIINPYPILFTTKAAESLKSYIKQGGHVVAEARLAWNDDRGYSSSIVPGMGLSDVFGIRETQVITRDEIKINVTDNSHPVMAKFNNNDTLKGAHFAESVEPLKDSKTQTLALLDDGTPCIVAAEYGRGKTLFIGSFLGLANYPASDKNNDQFILGLLDWANVERPFTSSHDGRAGIEFIEVRLQNNKHGYLLFVINHSKNSENISISLKTERNGSFRVRDVITDMESRVNARDFVLILNSYIDAKQVKVLDIRY